MNFVTAESYMLIMKTFCVLTVFVVAITASPSCLSYCDILYSGSITERRSDCNCFSSEKKAQDEVKHERGLKSLLFPLKLQNRETIFKDLHNNQEHGRISLTNIETDQILKESPVSGLGNSKPIALKHNKKKRTPDDGDIPVEIDNNSSKPSESSEDVLSNIDISERNLSDCIDLHILIDIRKHKNKKFINLELDGLKNKEHLNDFEINTQIKSKCDEANTIIQQSVAEIKADQKFNNRKKNQNVSVAPKIDTNTFEVLNETTPVILTDDDISRRQYDGSAFKNMTSYEESYTHAMTTTDNTPIPSSEALNDLNISSILHDNIQEATDKNFNDKDLNDSVAVITADDNSIDVRNNISRNLSVDTTTTTPTTIKISTDNKTNVSLKKFSKNNFNDKLVTEKSLNPILERINNKSVQIANDSDNVKENKFETHQFPKNSNKTVGIKTINLNENNTFPRDKYNEKEVPIIRIITREYPNDTISSVVNGTELLPNSDFEEEIINNKTKIIYENKTLKSIVPELEIQSRSYDTSTPSTSEKQTFANTSPVINGRLYFVFGQKHIPGYFVQTPDGLLHLSLDLNTICNESIQKG